MANFSAGAAPTRWVGLDNYRQVLGDGQFWRALTNNVWFVLAVVPLQDLFSLGTEARFNTPGVPSGNWRWRYRADALEKFFGGTTKYLTELATLTAR